MGPPWITIGSPPLDVLGTLAGVAFADMGGRNGPGRAVLRCDGQGRLAWRAPGSSTFGTPVECSAGGKFVLRDGLDGDKWVEVDVATGYLPAAPREALIELRERFNNAVVGGDVSSSQAAAGNVSTWTFDLKNRSATATPEVTLWLDIYTAQRYQISDDGSNWVAPLTQTSGLVVNLSAGGTATIHVRRTITAGQPASPGKRVRIKYRAQDYPSSEQGELTGIYRILNTPGYRAYKTSNGRPPRPGLDDPWDSFAALPHTVSDPPGDGDHQLAVTRFNGIFESPVGKIMHLLIEDGEQGIRPPQAPDWAGLDNIGAGVARLRACYASRLDVDERRATHWAVFVYDEYPPDPPGSEPDHEIVMQSGRGYALLDYNLPAVGDGVTVYVRVYASRGSGEAAVRSNDFAEALLIMRNSGPTAPTAQFAWARKEVT
jgi:hypothetical protein